MSAEIHGSRRSARETALGWLYEADLLDVSPADVLASQLLTPDAYAAALVDGIANAQTELDIVIAEVAEGWELGRMPVIDRALLRIAAYELAYRPDVPTGAVLSEAVELASAYSTDESSTFINGVLAAIAKRVRS